MYVGAFLGLFVNIMNNTLSTFPTSFKCEAIRRYRKLTHRERLCCANDQFFTCVEGDDDDGPNVSFAASVPRFMGLWATF